MTIGVSIYGLFPTGVEVGLGYFEFDFAAPAPAVSGGRQFLKSPEPVNLPDPKVLCGESFQKPCVTETGGKQLEFQATKGVFHKCY